MKKLISGAIGVKIDVQNVNKIYFPDLSILRGKRVKHISVHTVTANLRFCFATFIEQNTQNELIKSIPLNLLTMGDSPIFINKIIDLTKSYIDLSNLPVEQRTDYLYFVFWYDETSVFARIPEKNRTAINSLELKLTGAKTYFAENKQLTGKKFQNIILSFPNFSPSGNPVIPEGFHNKKYITLIKNNVEFFSKVPLFYFIQRDSDNPLRLQNISFDFQRSFIETEDLTENDLKTVFFNVITDENK